MESVNISTFKATCLTLIEKVKRTRQPILIRKRGEPIAVVQPCPLPKKPASWLGSFRSTGKIQGDIISPASGEDDWEILSS